MNLRPCNKKEREGVREGGMKENSTIDSVGCHGDHSTLRTGHRMLRPFCCAVFISSQLHCSVLWFLWCVFLAITLHRAVPTPPLWPASAHRSMSGPALCPPPLPPVQPSCLASSPSLLPLERIAPPACVSLYSPQCHPQMSAITNIFTFPRHAPLT